MDKEIEDHTEDEAKTELHYLRQEIAKAKESIASASENFRLISACYAKKPDETIKYPLDIDVALQLGEMIRNLEIVQHCLFGDHQVAVLSNAAKIVSNSLSYANKQIDDAEAEARSLAEFKKEHGYEKTEWAPGTDFF